MRVVVQWPMPHFTLNQIVLCLPTYDATTNTGNNIITSAASFTIATATYTDAWNTPTVLATTL